MIYSIDKKILIKDTGEKIELTYLESKLLESFKDENIVTYDKLAENLYKIDTEKLEDSLKEIKSKLCKKTGIQFKTRYKIGYVLITNINFI